MQYSPLVKRIAGEGADAWLIHYTARLAAERGEDVILLSVGDPDLRKRRAPILERAIEGLRAGDTHYTPASGRQHLREAIAASHRRRTGQAVEAANVIFLAGAQSALFVTSMCIAGPGDEVLALEPLYPSYPATLEVSGARMVRVAAPAANGFRIDLAALEAAITPQSRAIFFATPNNPSGAILSEADLRVIGGLARRHSLWVVADEVYAGLAPGGRVPSLAAELPEQTVTISSLSKSHAMPGWRAGWLVGPAQFRSTHAEAMARKCMLFGLPGFVQEAAVTALSVAEAAEIPDPRIPCPAARSPARRARRHPGTQMLRSRMPGMFLLLDVRGTGLSGYDFMCELYRTERVSVLDGGAFGRETQGFVRVCFAADQALLREAAVRIRRFVASRVR